MLKTPWSQAHAEAHQIEHAISEETEAQMRASLDDPQVCPHGNPLPGYEAVAAHWLPLTETRAGDRLIIRRIHEAAEADTPLLQFLESNAIAPGVRSGSGRSVALQRDSDTEAGRPKIGPRFLGRPADLRRTNS